MLGTMFHSNHKREFVVIGLARDEVTGQIAKAPAKRSVFSKKALIGEMEEKIKGDQKMRHNNHRTYRIKQLTCKKSLKKFFGQSARLKGLTWRFAKLLLIKTSKMRSTNKTKILGYINHTT